MEVTKSGRELELVKMNQEKVLKLEELKNERQKKEENMQGTILRAILFQRMRTEGEGGIRKWENTNEETTRKGKDEEK